MKIDFNPKCGFDIRLENGEKHTIRWILSDKQQVKLTYWREEEDGGWKHIKYTEPVSFIRRKIEIDLGGSHDPGFRYWEDGDEIDFNNRLKGDEVFELCFEDPTPVPYNGNDSLEFPVMVDDKTYTTYMSINTYHQSKDGLLTVGKLLEMLKDVDPNTHLYISTTADDGYINCDGYVDDILIDDNGVTFYSEE